MCEICEEREPQTQNTQDTNIGMIEGYAQDIIDMCRAWTEPVPGLYEYQTMEELVSDLKDRVAYLADHMAAL